MISIVIPVYNEEDKLEKNILTLVNYMKRLNLKNEIILSNDGSTDKSFDIIKKLSNINNNIKFINNNKNKGRGHALKRTCSSIKGTRVLFMDVDIPLTIDLRIIEKMIHTLKKYDIVIASRYMPNSRIKRKFYRSMLSKIYITLVRIIFPKLRIHDTDVGLKAFRKDIFISINGEIKSNGWPWDLEFMLEARKRKYTIKELPLCWEEKGKSSLNIFSTSYEQLLSLWRFRIRYS